MYGANQRQRTPLSPSPSPEPAEGDERHRQQHVARPIGGGPQPDQPPAGNGLAEADGTEAVDVAQERARKTLEERIRQAIDDLMQLATYAAEVQQGDENIVGLKLNETMESLQALQDATNLPDLRQLVPEDVMDMIDAGRNPDIHTRTLTNRLNSDNQQMRGQAQNLNHYRNRLRDKMGQAFPEMEGDLSAVDKQA